jgi:biotin carboxyl carrier protein
MELTNDDVAEILALLDSLPYDELDLQTPRFRLTLRRTPGGWTEESQVLADPVRVTPEPNGSPAARPRADSPATGTGADSPATGTGADSPATGGGKSDISEMSGGTAGPGAGTDLAAAGSATDLAGAGDTAMGADAGAERGGVVAVTAPLPGTFYRAPRPGAAPFVEVGDEVAEDTVVAIVETMKLMNSVHAGTRGRVARICLENAEMAAQGATLMWIEPGT